MWAEFAVRHILALYSYMIYTLYGKDLSCKNTLIDLPICTYRCTCIMRGCTASGSYTCIGICCIYIIRQGNIKWTMGAARTANDVRGGNSRTLYPLLLLAAAFLLENIASCQEHLHIPARALSRRERPILSIVPALIVTF
jgi:hypothetical protein